MSVYDGLERTETQLLDKLSTLASGALNEDVEAKFWLSLVQGGSSNAVHSEITRSLFGLQRLAAILNDFDSSPEALDEAMAGNRDQLLHAKSLKLGAIRLADQFLKRTPPSERMLEELEALVSEQLTQTLQGFKPKRFDSLIATSGMWRLNLLFVKP